MFQKLLLISLIAASLGAQTLGSAHDPQIAEFILEAKLPLSQILFDNPNALPLPEQVRAGIMAGVLEIRGRVEYNRAARIFRIYQLVVPSNSPYPLPQSPALDSPAAAAIFDMSVDNISWFEFTSSATNTVRKVATVLGKTLFSYRGGATAAEPCVFTLSFEKSSPSKFGIFTLTFAGAITAVALNPVGTLRLDPPLINIL